MSQIDAATIYARRRRQIQEAAAGVGNSDPVPPSALPSPDRVYAARRAAVLATPRE